MTDHDSPGFIDVNKDAAKGLFRRNPTGAVVMLNMLRFRDVADYSVAPDLAPERPISGSEAYRRYSLNTLPLVHAAGGSVTYAGSGGEFLIGPADETWDRVLLVRHKSLQAFRAFASDQAYLSGVGHRTAALLDSRLLPLTDLD